MTKSITFSSDVVPACLQIEVVDVDPEVKLIVSGWGTTTADRELKINFTIGFFFEGSSLK